MPPTEHAKLSPSAAKRWINCPGSVALEENLPNPPQSEYATEGSLAHRLAEIRVQHEIMNHKYDRRQCNDVIEAINNFYASATVVEGSFDEINENVTKYIEYIKTVLPAKAQIETEKPVILSDYIPDGWGTTDLVITDYDNKTCNLIDFKYGQGVKVSAQRNYQLMIYALGVLSECYVFGDDIDTVTLTIFQPRMDYVDTETWHAEDLKAWGESIVKPAAGVAFTEPTGNLKYFREGDWCTFCKANKAGVCPLAKNYAERAAKLAKEQDVPIDEDVSNLSISKEEIEKILPHKKAIERYLKSLETASIEYLSSGDIIPGVHLSRHSGAEKWADNVDESGVALTNDKGRRMTVKQARKKLSDEDFEKVRPYIIKSPDTLRVTYTN